MRGAVLAVVSAFWLCACAQAGTPTQQNTGDDASAGSAMPDGNTGMHACTTSCDDSNACTTDTCDNGTCAHVALSCDDSDVCTTDTCDMVMGCVHSNNTHGTQTFTANGAMQTFAVPACVTSLHILAAGGQGGGVAGTAFIGGLGSTLEGDFPVAVGQTLNIIVGSAGINGVGGTTYAQRGGTGGGGSFVVRNLSILVIAGGGGGACGPVASVSSPGINGGPGVLTTNGAAGSGGAGGAAGGANGAGGSVWSNSMGYQTGTGGGGYSGNGVGNSDGDTSMYGSPNTPGIAFVNGGAGGTGGNASNRNGGFGGGGAAGFSGGGGGGYSGGGAGGYGGTTYSGGGGGSINNGANQNNVGGNHAGAGTVVVTW